MELDSNGEPLIYTKDGQRVLLDENGNPYYIDENGNRVYIDKDTPIVSSNGVEIPRDESGNLIFKDKNGNDVSIEGDKRITTDKNGNKIIEDKNGNYEKYDKDDKLIEKGKRDPFADENAKNQHTQNNNTNASKSDSQPKDETKYLYDENGNIIGDSVALENQKFDPKKADSKQKNINNILASRFNTPPSKEEKKKEIEYGANEFSNLDERDEGSNEHKLLRTITADRMIPAFLVRPISSQLAGNVVAQVETNIYGAMGRAVLIPKGSRVIGFYQNNNKIGEYRLDVIWTRIITPQGINILLTNAKGADVKGYNGLVGEVHSRNFQRYGIPITLSTLSNGLLLAVNSLNESANANNQNANNQIAQSYMTAQIMSGMRQDISTIVQRIVQEQMKIQPIITIREGSRIFIAPSVDIFIPVPKKGETLARFFKEEKQQSDEENQNNQEESDENNQEL
ncbi:DNA type IV secretion system protein ComB10 [uncultured Helicobacter sp.]|uniref:DNA type IV secretion system protein ComB10 n=1 Tax=uncultured Helicobacter sp. TaxID=175537 RepID=UPI00374F7B5B